MRIAEAAVTAFGQTDPLADLLQVGDDGLAILLQDLGAGRHAQDDGRRIRPRAVLTHAMTAGLCLEMLLVAVVDQGVQPVDRLDPDVAAAPAVAAVRSA